jgi:hypothetical protein
MPPSAEQWATMGEPEKLTQTLVYGGVGAVAGAIAVGLAARHPLGALAGAIGGVLASSWLLHVHVPKTPLPTIANAAANAAARGA